MIGCCVIIHIDTQLTACMYLDNKAIAFDVLWQAIDPKAGKMFVRVIWPTSLYEARGVISLLLSLTLFYINGLTSRLFQINIYL